MSSASYPDKNINNREWAEEQQKQLSNIRDRYAMYKA